MDLQVYKQETYWMAFIRQINFILVGIEMVGVGYVVVNNPEQAIAIPLLVLDLLPSLMFQLDRNLINYRLFNWFAHFMSTLELGLIFTIVLALVFTHENPEELFLVVPFLILNISSILIPTTLLILLNNQQSQQKRVVYLIPVEQKSYTEIV